MQFDLLTAIGLTARAAIAISVFGTDTVARVRIALGLVLWFIFVTLMASTHLAVFYRLNEARSFPAGRRAMADAGRQM